jgi:hypothetical protein
VPVTDSLFVNLTLMLNNGEGIAVYATGISDEFSLTSSLFIGSHSDHMEESRSTSGGAVYASAISFSVESCCGVRQFLYLNGTSDCVTSNVTFVNTLYCGHPTSGRGTGPGQWQRQGISI